MDRYRHRPDPDNPGQDFHAPFYGKNAKSYATTQPHELTAPPRGDQEYLDALVQVRGKEIAPESMGTLPNQIKGRNVDQTVIGIFWGYDGAAKLGTPPRLYNQIIGK